MKPLYTLTKSNSLNLNQCRTPPSTLPDVVWDDDSPQWPSYRAVQNHGPETAWQSKRTHLRST